MAMELKGILDLENDLHGEITIPVIRGEKGEKGDTGDRGETGTGIAEVTLNPDYTLTVTMTDGTTYTTASIRGEQGERGERGETGATGEPGHVPVIGAEKAGSVTTITVGGTVIATVNDGLKGDKGDKGDTGEQGLKGDKGDKGDAGERGLQGEKGDTGEQGEQGIQGIQGIQGEKGDKGDKGDPGDDYVLTAADKADIASLVDVIDDTSSAIDKTWSASKIASELSNAGSVKDVTIAGQSLVDANGIAAVDNIGQSISITVTGTDPVIQASSNARYICGEVATLSFTPCASGICEVIFTSGTTPTVMAPLPETVQMPEWFVVEANHTYEISVIDGTYGAVMVW